MDLVGPGGRRGFDGTHSVTICRTLTQRGLIFPVIHLEFASGGVCMKRWPIWQGMRQVLARGSVSDTELSVLAAFNEIVLLF